MCILTKTAKCLRASRAKRAAPCSRIHEASAPMPPRGRGEGGIRIQRTCPCGLQLGALGRSLFLAARASRDKRVRALCSLPEGSAKGDQCRRQGRGDREELPHPRLFRFREDGKRIAAGADYGDAVRHRRKPSAHGMPHVVRERPARRRATQGAGDKGWKRLPCKDILHGFLDPRLLL